MNFPDQCKEISLRGRSLGGVRNFTENYMYIYNEIDKFAATDLGNNLSRLPALVLQHFLSSPNSVHDVNELKVPEIVFKIVNH